MAKILVYELDTDYRNQLKTILTGLGHEVVIAQDGYSVLPLAEKNRPQVIMLDYRPPEVDGFEIMKRLREAPACANTPIVFASATPKFEIEFVVLDAPRIGYVDKPLAAAQVKEVVESFVGAAAQPAKPAPSAPAPSSSAPEPKPAFNGEPDLDGVRDDVIELE